MKSILARIRAIFPAKLAVKISKKVAIIITAGIIVLSGTITGIAVGVTSKNKGYTYSLSMASRNLTFFSLDTEYNFPTVITEDKDMQVKWVLKNSENDYDVAFISPDNENKFKINFIDKDENTDKLWAKFAAIITGSKSSKPIELDFTVNVTDKGENYFETLSSTQYGHVNYETRGIGQSRVFGLYDITDQHRETTPQNFASVPFALSWDSFELQWRYKENVEIEISVEGDAVAVSTNTATRNIITQDDIDKTIKVDFIKEGKAKVIAKSTTPYAPNRYATYEYVYDIKNAVNAYDFADIKLMEKLARYDYISNGVAGVQRQDGTDITGGTLSDYINTGSDPNGLLSAHFKTTATTYSSKGLTNVIDTGRGINTDYRGDTTGSYFNEFEQWAPAYRFEDIVIRSTHKDRVMAQRSGGHMYTWAESTWFFGSVYGNGYALDATTYTRGVDGYDEAIYRNPEGRYRNIHSTRADNADMKRSLGFDGKKFFQGYGWGEIFAFYALSNNSVIDNLTLTGENIPSGANAIRLYQYRKIGVLGVSTLAGKYLERIDNPDGTVNEILSTTMIFGQGNAHKNGEPINGLYNKNIKVQNSILEKGLTLFGANYAPDQANPLVADTCVFRYAGFSGIVGNSYGGGVGGRDFEGGKEIALNNTLLSSSRKDNVIDGEGDCFGNFIIARNNIYHDISVTPLLTMPSLSGTHLSVQGDNNGFFTWLASDDIQFPTMKNDAGDNEGEYKLLGQTINTVVMPLMKKLFSTTRNNRLVGGDNLSAKHIPENGTGVFVINIPYISVVDSGAPLSRERNPEFAHNRNMLVFEDTLAAATRADFGFVLDALGGSVQKNQGFYFAMMLNYDEKNPATHTVTRYEDQTIDGINEKIRQMIPA